MSAIQGKATSGPGSAASAELAGLLRQVARHDHAAFRSLYDLTHRRLFGMALLLLKNRELAEDAVQEAYIRIWTRAGTFDPGMGEPLPWLGRILRNIAIDHVRRKTVQIDSLDDHHEIAADSSISVFAVTELNRCLAKLDPSHRASWWMIHIDGLSREDAALQMKVPLGTVKTWVYRSTRRIRSAIEG